MTTNDTGTVADRKLASVGIVDEALRDIGLCHIRSPTYFQVGKTLLIADCVVGHAP